MSDAKSSVLNGKVYKTLAKINLYEITNWQKVKKQDTWVYAQFHNSHNVEFGIKHLAYPFETAVLTDILSFDITLLDDSNKLIEFKGNSIGPVQRKVSSFSFDGQIIKWLRLDKT